MQPLQSVIAALIVAVAGGYAAWTLLLSRPWRARAAQAVSSFVGSQRGVPVTVQNWLRDFAALQAANGGGCGACKAARPATRQRQSRSAAKAGSLR